MVKLEGLRVSSRLSRELWQRQRSSCLAARVVIVLQSRRSGEARAKDDSDVAIKQVECRCRATEKEVLHELDALNAVAEKELDGCMPGCGAYVELMSLEGGLIYHLAMPCAPALLAPSKNFRLGASVRIEAVQPVHYQGSAAMAAL